MSLEPYLSGPFPPVCVWPDCWSLCCAALPSCLRTGWLPVWSLSHPISSSWNAVSKHILSGSFLFHKLFLGILWCAQSPLLCELSVLFCITFITSCPVLNVEFMDFFPIYLLELCTSWIQVLCNLYHTFLLLSIFLIGLHPEYYMVFRFFVFLFFFRIIHLFVVFSTLVWNF